jgi:hypothetical protein
VEVFAKSLLYNRERERERENLGHRKYWRGGGAVTKHTTRVAWSGGLGQEGNGGIRWWLRLKRGTFASEPLVRMARLRYKGGTFATFKRKYMPHTFAEMYAK